MTGDLRVRIWDTNNDTSQLKIGSIVKVSDAKAISSIAVGVDNFLTFTFVDNGAYSFTPGDVVFVEFIHVGDDDYLKDNEKDLVGIRFLNEATSGSGESYEQTHIAGNQSGISGVTHQPPPQAFLHTDLDEPTANIFEGDFETFTFDVQGGDGTLWEVDLEPRIFQNWVDHRFHEENDRKILLNFSNNTGVTNFVRMLPPYVLEIDYDLPEECQIS
jgi:hypothetical protein